MGKTDVKKQWIKLVSEFDLCNEDRKTFCEKRKLSYKVFGYWYVRYSKSSKSSKKVITENSKPQKSAKIENQRSAISEPKNSLEWVEVKIETPVEKTFTKPSLKVKIGKAEIIVEEGFDKCLFYDVTKLLGELC